MMFPKLITAFCFGILIIPVLWWGSNFTFAQSQEVEQLQSEIKQRNDRLQEIQKEIAKYEVALTQVGSEKKTLQNAINKLELERKKIQADISYTDQSISSTDLQLSKLTLEISKTENDIITNKEAISEIVRELNQSGDISLLETLLTYKRLSEFWSSLESLNSVRDSMSTKVRDLITLQAELEGKQTTTNKQRGQLVELKNQYSDQNKVLTNNKAEQASLLAVTKDKESNYQRILREQKAAKDALEREVRDFEAKLQFILDPSTIPSAGTAVFAWPLSNIIITQLFGGTEFAKRNASVYGGRAYHPGIDIGTPSGSKIFAPLAGTVRATGNTDAVPGCYSWGKWTLLDHSNGLSTLYAHQSVISVVPGQHVETGEVIGYSGNTGYSTGPHLHFTVYAKSGVTIRRFNEIKAVTGCGSATTPVAATDAYLDPMLYLPQSGYTTSL